MPGNIIHLTPADIAKWPKANYHNPQTETWLPAYTGTWFAAGTVLVAIRFWLRLRGHSGKLGLDDAILFPGWLAGLMFTIASFLYIDWTQGGRHVWDVEPDERSNVVLCMWLGQVAFLLCGFFTKVSILLFYRRLVAGTCSLRYKWMIWFAIAFTVVYTIVFGILLLTNCTPLEAYWRAFDFKYALTADYTCIQTKSINTIAGICAVLSDCYAVALPCVITWKLQMPRRQKIALNVIFCLGLVVVAAGGVRTYWHMKVGYSKDVTRTAFNLFIWAQFELQAGIMCASAPALRIFFRRYLGSLSGSRSATGGSGSTALDKPSIVVVRATQVTFDKQEHSRSGSATRRHDFDAVSEGEEEIEEAWEANRSQERLTLKEDGYAMADLGGKQIRSPVL